MTFPIHTEQNKCHPNPCRNGGTCTGINEAEGFECTCREGFKGKNCEGNMNDKNFTIFYISRCPHACLAVLFDLYLAHHHRQFAIFSKEDMRLLLDACAIKICIKILCKQAIFSKIICCAILIFGHEYKEILFTINCVDWIVLVITLSFWRDQPVSS